MKLYKDLGLTSCCVTYATQGKTLEELDLPSSATAIAHIRDEHEQPAEPGKKLKESDYILFVASTDDNEELYDRAQELGVGGRSDMTKDELIRALRHH